MGDNFSSRIRNSSNRKRSNIILALDLIRKNGLAKYLSETVSSLESGLCAVKFNFHVILPLGQDEMTKLIEICHSYDMQVIADVKLNDIPSTNNTALKWLTEEGFDAVIANPIIGRMEIIELAKKAHSLGAGIIALIYMSHPGASQTYGIQVYDKNEISGTMRVPLYRIFLKYAKEAKADGLIVGATRPHIIKEIAADKPAPIFSPGLGLQGGSILDAARSGVDYVIVGRSIIHSPEPLRALALLKDSLGRS
ncbi:MAG TPA: orotidine 5'-phosphate decarboxylase [Nitrososphaeraceae archaeon]|nr:orotidine 5'-phosphate decarboxylase [Nitrososphaeraceae archaeon]